jgi:acyltransferase
MSQKNTPSKKDATATKLKGIAILAVIFGHISSPLTAFIFAWHMPLFFFLSGFFIKTNGSTKNFIVKNTKKLMVYFFVFTFIGFLSTYFRNILISRENGSIADGLYGIFYWMDMQHLDHYGFVLWFLPALLWGKLIVYSLLKYIKSKVVVGILIGSIFYLSTFIIKLPFVIDIGLISTIWIYLGYIFFHHIRHHIIKYWKYIFIPIFISLYFIPIPNLNLADRTLSFPMYNVTYSLLMIVTLYILASKINIKKNNHSLLNFLGENSMFLFIFHPYTNNIVYIFVNRYLNDIWYIKFILSFALIYLALIIKKKYFNKGILKHV